MKIYTKTGDDGTTGLLGPGRVPKNSPRIEAYGAVDELNAALGLVRAVGPGPTFDAMLASAQDDLFAAGAALADPNPQGRFFNALDASRAVRLERQIDSMEGSLAPLTQFILPGGHPAAAHTHLARGICRRAERLTVALAQTEGERIDGGIIVYLNRLSDFLFVLARAINAAHEIPDTAWAGLS